jgi:UDP-glucose 4-epimerase
MRILFTGASSFTGFWFVRALAAAGHQVTATFRQPLDAYPDERRRVRVALLEGVCKPVFGTAFGDAAFLALIRDGRFDLLAHHGAEVSNYRSTDFDAVAALGNNARSAGAVLGALRETGCRRVLLTGSVFEGGEGAGSDGLPDVSAYGLSKRLTFETFRFHCARSDLHLGKFVVPNPFGAHEEPRYTAYLLQTWFAGGTARCASPAYIRDNAHAPLLAAAYAHFAAALPTGRGISRLNPSGYVESQGAFTRRVAEEMRGRLALSCAVELAEQTEFAEPRIRINIDPLDARALGCDEASAWDQMAQYYRGLYAR